MSDNNLIAVVIDWETLDVIPTARVLSLGAYAFSRTDEEFESAFYTTFQQDPQVDYTTIHNSTIRWWQKQNPDTKAEAFKETEHPQVALWNFDSWLTEISKGDLSRIRLYGNGGDFDIPILHFQARQWNIVFPSTFFLGHRCLRTLYAIYKKEIPKIEPRVPHHAMYDALAEATWLERLFDAHPELFA